jgi:hypothetical protein
VISTEEREEMGPPPVTYRETGVMRAHVWLHVRKLDGVSAARSVMSRRCAICFAIPSFRRRHDLRGRAARRSMRNNRRGVWYVVPVEVPYHRDYIKG